MENAGAKASALFFFAGQGQHPQMHGGGDPQKIQNGGLLFGGKIGQQVDQFFVEDPIFLVKLPVFAVLPGKLLEVKDSVECGGGHRRCLLLYSLREIPLKVNKDISLIA